MTHLDHDYLDHLVMGILVLHPGYCTVDVSEALGESSPEVRESICRLLAEGRIRVTSTTDVPGIGVLSQYEVSR